MRKVDIVIISDAKCEPLLKETHRAIESLNQSESPEDIHFNIFVVESTKEVNYDEYCNVETIHPDVPFGYL